MVGYQVCSSPYLHVQLQRNETGPDKTSSRFESHAKTSHVWIEAAIC